MDLCIYQIDEITIQREKKSIWLTFGAQYLGSTLSEADSKNKNCKEILDFNSIVLVML